MVIITSIDKKNYLKVADECFFLDNFFGDKFYKKEDGINSVQKCFLKCMASQVVKTFKTFLETDYRF